MRGMWLMIRGRMGHLIVRNALLLYVVQFSGYVFPLITVPYLSRTLSPEKFGLVAFAQYFAWYFIILTEYGFNLTATRTAAAHRDDPVAVSRLFSDVMAAKALLTALGFLILSLAILLVPTLRQNRALFLISFLAVAGNMLFPLWLYQGMQKMGQIAVRDFVARLLSLVALFVWVHSDRDYLLAAAAQAGAYLLAGVSGLVTVFRQFQIRLQPPTIAGIREQLVSGWAAFVSLAIGAFGGITNTLVLGLWAPGAENAYFVSALRVISVPRALVAPIATALFPHISVKASRSEGEVISFAARYALVIIAPFFAGGAVLLFTARWLVPLFLSARYVPAIPVMQVMAFSPFLLAMGHVFSTCYMLPCGYDRAWLRIMSGSVVVNFLVLIPAFYLTRPSLAAALAGLTMELFSATMYFRFFWRQRKAWLAKAAG